MYEVIPCFINVLTYYVHYQDVHLIIPLELDLPQCLTNV